MKIYDRADGSKILLVRPGATEFDEQGRIIGTLDIPLSELGLAQVEELAESSVGLDIKAVLSSPSLAAQQTAEVLGKKHGRKIKVRNALRNIDMGLWQGKELEELRANQPKVARQWEDHPETVCPPEGESIEDVLPRVQKLLLKLQKKHRAGTIVIVVADPLAKVIASLLSQQAAPEPEAAAAPDKDSPVEHSGCGKMDLLPLSVELADV
ncbi:histidine phosphatase family protein [Mariniblastus fucicola]|uniref:Phosphoserine phosphatase 1 n=1 Tax=Mariniblastus fucicola TaxID=980251 RepID=A0A5B9PFB9_9BACT|nr:histidine phosphatase family protein [Mariniblastus fucicola]QEG21671.1 Phosphoserine phosphatase 1 [Mariniblastus fucicola]